MELDLSSYFAASLGLVLLLLVLKFIMHKTDTILKFGITGLYVLVILILMRGYLPFDFYKINLTTSFYSHKVLPFLRDIFYYKINAGGKIMTVRQITLIIFIVGWIWMLCKKIYGYFAFNKFINSAPHYNKAGALQICEDVFYTIFPQDRKFDIKIVQSNILSSPAIFLSPNPIIILPDILFTEEELKFVFYHELIHLKHRDFIIKVATDFLIAAYWWNPVIRIYLFDIINHVQELNVDYEASKGLTKNEKLVYLNVISKTADYICKNKKKRKPIYALSDEHPLNILQRLSCIISSKVNGLTFKGIIVSIILFICSFTFVFEPSYQVTHDEGDKIFYGDEELSYYIWDGTNYELYISGECVCTTPKIHENLKNLPVYSEEKE